MLAVRALQACCSAGRPLHVISVTQESCRIFGVDGRGSRRTRSWQSSDGPHLGVAPVQRFLPEAGYPRTRP
jgi:hypothetical protein